MSDLNFTNPHLSVQTPQGLLQVELQRDSTVLIGSGGHCKIQLLGNGIRSLHCVVANKEDGQIELRDWNTGCTLVNGNAISEPVILNHNDRINVAENEIVVVLQSPDAAPTQINDTAECLDQHHTVQLVSRMEELLQELRRSDGRATELAERLHASEQATQDQREECVRLEQKVQELESRSLDAGDDVVDGSPSIPLEMAVALKEQIESLMRQLQASQQEVEQLKTSQLPQETPSQIRVELSRARADLARERASLESLKVELETRLEKREVCDGDKRVKAMREHLKELHEKDLANRPQATAQSTDSGIAGRLTSLLQNIRHQN